MRADAEGPGRFSEHGDVARVRAEALRVRPHPAQRRPLVGEGETGGPAELRMAEQAEDAQPVVDGHDHGVALDGQPVGAVGIARSAEEAATVEPDHDGPQPPSGGAVRRDGDVEVQAVLGAGRPAGPEHGQLYTAGTGGPGVAHALPPGRRLRKPPAQRAGRGSGEGDALEGAVRAVVPTAYGPPVGVHHGLLRTGRRPHQHQHDRQEQRAPASDPAKVGHGRRPFPLGPNGRSPFARPEWRSGRKWHSM